jgi:hypothetical protein
MKQLALTAALLLAFAVPAVAEPTCKPNKFITPDEEAAAINHKIAKAVGELYEKTLAKHRPLMLVAPPPAATGLWR